MKRPYVDHFPIAETCRTAPRQWHLVGEYNSTQSARGVVLYIEQASTRGDGRNSAYQPAGSFEARYELTDFGARVEARYVGISADAAWADAIASLTPA